MSARQRSRRRRAGVASAALAGALAIMAAGAGPTRAQTPGPAPAAETSPRALPHGDVFPELLADPAAPRFFASLLRSSSPVAGSWVAAVGFGEDVGLVRWPGSGPDDGLQIGLSGGVLAQFDMETPSNDLINADYVIGLPITYRRGAVGARLRLYHQSSHLGDEFLLRENPERLNLSFEAVEGLAALTVGRWRLYGGGEVIVRREPADLARTSARFGAELRTAEPVLVGGAVGAARFVAGLDVRLPEEHDWTPAWSFKTGLEFAPADEAGAARHWSLLLELYDGPAPYGQFFPEHVTYAGVAISFGL